MIAAKDSPLVAGGSPKKDERGPVTVKALRGFLYAGKPVIAGAVIDIPVHLAAELVAMHKAERYVVPAVVVEEPAPAPSAKTETPRRHARPTTKE
jgi:hypothetical protein